MKLLQTRDAGLPTRSRTASALGMTIEEADPSGVSPWIQGVEPSGATPTPLELLSLF